MDLNNDGSLTENEFIKGNNNDEFINYNYGT